MQQHISLFVMRMVLGVIFLVNGIVKFQTMADTVGWFQSIGLPAFMAYVVMLLEIVGGIGLMIGLGTRIFSVLFSAMLIGAILLVKVEAGFLAGWSYDLALLAIALFLAVNGSPTLSIDRLFKRKPQSLSEYLVVNEQDK